VTSPLARRRTAYERYTLVSALSFCVKVHLVEGLNLVALSKLLLFSISSQSSSLSALKKKVMMTTTVTTRTRSGPCPRPLACQDPSPSCWRWFSAPAALHDSKTEPCTRRPRCCYRWPWWSPPHSAEIATPTSAASSIKVAPVHALMILRSYTACRYKQLGHDDLRVLVAPNVTFTWRRHQVATPRPPRASETFEERRRRCHSCQPCSLSPAQPPWP